MLYGRRIFLHTILLPNNSFKGPDSTARRCACDHDRRQTRWAHSDRLPSVSASKSPRLWDFIPLSASFTFATFGPSSAPDARSLHDHDALHSRFSCVTTRGEFGNEQ